MTNKIQSPNENKYQTGRNKIAWHLDFDIWPVFGFWILKFGFYLKFDICNLKF